METPLTGKPNYTGPCIYSITNDFNQRVYIGSTRNAKSRYFGHLAAMKRMSGENPGILADLSGGHTFTFKILNELPKDTPQIVLNDLEHQTIKSTDNPYNISDSMITTEKLIDEMDFQTGPARRFIPSFMKSIAFSLHCRDLLTDANYSGKSYGEKQIDEAAEELHRIVNEAAEALKKSLNP